MHARTLHPPLTEWITMSSGAVLPSILDRTLLTAMHQGIPAALGHLYDRYGRLVFAVALRITGDQPTATIVTEDVFEHLWTEAERIPCECGSCAAWMFHTTRQCAWDATHYAVVNG